MDARTAESPVISQQQSWLQRERASGRFYDRIAVLAGLLLVGMLGLSAWLLTRSAEPDTLLKPPQIALLLIAILLPAIALMALYARKVAVRRAERGGLGSGRLHVRLVALFTAVAAVPTVLVAIFASVLFQSGLEFWSSKRARSMLEGTVQVARATYRYELGQVGSQAIAMSGDLAADLQKLPIDDPRFKLRLAYQTYVRSLNEAAILNVGPTGQVQTLGVANGYDGMINEPRLRAAVASLNGKAAGAVVDARTPNRISILTRMNYGPNTYLYTGRWVDPEIASQIQKANLVLKDYRSLLNRARINQLRFNVLL
ncbi:MAG TPA: PAS domain-containing sensor histidine kinase, partial [Sphingomicrobium sp.]|nr:PAS domain-containing sensor histidine kinase [Sphingomicrobium sp.]